MDIFYDMNCIGSLEFCNTDKYSILTPTRSGSMVLAFYIYWSHIDMGNILEEYFFVITRIHDKILYRFERVGIVIDEDIIGFVIADDRSNDSLSEALSEFRDNTH